MKIGIIGTGYVGLVAGVCFANAGYTVLCADNNKEKIAKLSKGIIESYEPELENLLLTNLQNSTICFTADIQDVIENRDIIFIAVGTPAKDDGSVDLSYYFSVMESIKKYINRNKILVIKSTIPLGTIEKTKEFFSDIKEYSLDIVVNPEFLRQGSAVYDFQFPQRIVLGGESEDVLEIIKNLYVPFALENKFYCMDYASAIMVKYASNAFLATKISFINEMNLFCESFGADINYVSKAMGLDSRIGSSFLNAGLGYGGSCFPKDVKALIDIAKAKNIPTAIINATEKINQQQRKLFINKVLSYFQNTVHTKKIAILGLAFKPNTDDMREAPAITIIEELLNVGANIIVYDPKAINNAKKIFNNTIEYANDCYSCVTGCDCVLFLTEWQEFKEIDFEKMKKLLKNTILFDGRNFLNKKSLKELGYTIL